MRLWPALLATSVLLAPSLASADRTVVVLFRGFAATPPSGMDRLEARLASEFGGDPGRPYSGQVFDWFEEQQAFDFINGFGDIGRLIIGGHSFGGDAAIELATDFLLPAGIPVDLLYQFDSVGNGDETLPAGVVQGYNFWQVSTGGILEPQGEAVVAGSINEQVEQFYTVGGVVDNSSITHTEIDCPLFERTPAQYLALFGPKPDLFDRIAAQAVALLPVGVPGLGIPGLAVLAGGILATSLRRIRRRARTRDAELVGGRPVS